MSAWYDTEDVAHRYGVCPRTVQRWARKRFIPHIRVGEGRSTRLKFTAAHLAEFDQAWERRPREPVEVDAPNPSFQRSSVVVPMVRPGAA